MGTLGICMLAPDHDIHPLLELRDAVDVVVVDEAYDATEEEEDDDEDEEAAAEGEGEEEDDDEMGKVSGKGESTGVVETCK